MKRRCDRRSIVPRTAPRSRRVLVSGLVLLLGVAAACGGSSGGAARLYLWTDEEGSVHYTAKRSAIPRAYRSSARSVDPGGSEGPESTGGIALATDPAQSVSGTGAEPAPLVAADPGRGAEAKSVEAGPPSTTKLDARIREVEAAIARDQEALKVLIAEDPAEGRDSLAQSQQLREIAHRLPGLQAELRSLRAQRAAQAAP
jgi:hypothetical protein